MAVVAVMALVAVVALVVLMAFTDGLKDSLYLNIDQSISEAGHISDYRNNIITCIINCKKVR